MPYSSPKSSLKTEESQTTTQQLSQKTSNQYGINVLAKENLTHVTSYLDPASLLSLSAVNKLFNEHVRDDHTWRRAFLLNFLGIKPEADLDSSTGLLLRRSESSWAKEYVARCNLRRRWESQRNQTITYSPVHSSVSDIHLLRSQNTNTTSLLASSLKYGIVSRSFLLTGRLLRGFLSPSLAGTGLGVGNPNTEFAPNVTACTMTSDGGTAKIAWGTRNGEVAVSIAAKTMETNTRSAAKLVRCSVQDQHEGEVMNIVWDDAGALVTSGAKDGRIKIWDAKTLRCLWTSEYLIPDYPVAVRLGTTKVDTLVVAGMSNGDLMVWTVAITTADPGELSTLRGTKVKVPCPVKAKTPEEPNRIPTDPIITTLHVDVLTNTDFVYVTVSYDSHPEFYRIAIPLENPPSSVPTPQPSIIGFKDPDSVMGTVTSVFPCLCTTDHNGETGFILTGTSLGWVCVYPYPSTPQSTTQTISSVGPIRKFEAHTDGSSVTALAWNSVTLVTGSSTGNTTVFDGYTFERLRTFPIRHRGGGLTTSALETNEGVKKILLSPEKDVMVATVGDRVLGLKADLVPKSNKMQARKVGKKKARGTTVAKGHDHHMLNQLISDSMHEHDAETQHMRKVYGRERQQRQDLARLGLDEVEAVEYVLMLSREEALAREAQEAQALVEEGVFEGDFDFGDSSVRVSRGPIASTSARSESSSRSSSGGSSSSPSPGLSASQPPPPQSLSPSRSSQPIYSPYTPPRPFSNDKVQVSPRFRQEAREAGWGDHGDEEYPPGAAVSQSWGSVASSISDIDLSAGSGVGVGAGGSINGKKAVEDPFPSISPKMSKGVSGAWAARSPSSSVILATSSKQPVKNNGKVPKASSPPASTSWSVGDDEDEDLRLAIQLSLEEARMRGEVV
ncbi:hypothetical protein L218DRAFT_1076054 [Marasmius fiardii PR-910]|nr:hypothetical protein L218DRAFT_1076054 [Marasmius fiardii PR-910]